MVFYEKKASRNGEILPVEYILMRQTGKRLEPHLHYHEYTELLFGISGESAAFVGGEVYRMKKGDMVIVRDGIPHDVASFGTPCSYHVVKFLPQILFSEGQTMTEYSYVLMLMEQMPGTQCFFPSSELKNSEIPLLFRRLETEWEKKEFGYELSLRADVTRIFLMILRRWQEENCTLVDAVLKSGRRELMQKAVSYIREHYADMNESEAAEACGVTSAYLSRSFKSCMKQSFSGYVSGVRLKEAQKQLLLTDDSITDIAEAVGFSTSAYFIARFRETYGMTPKDFRKRSREAD